MKKKLLFSITLFFLSITLTQAQALFYNSGEVYIDSGVLVHVNGTFENNLTPLLAQSATILENNGTITAANDDNPGTFSIQKTATVRGNGIYNVEQNWINNSPNFIANDSKVFLFGDIEQRITGTEEPTFSELILTGNGLTGTDRVKRMFVNTYIVDTLHLNDRELATDSFVLFIENSDPAAITHNDTFSKEGFISSLRGQTDFGYLSRKTSNSAEPYLFPVGSSVNPPSGSEFVYRPIELRPITAAVNEFTVRFTYKNPTADGADVSKFDSTICTVNNLYYYDINHPLGFDSADITIVYDPIVDGTHDRMAQWTNTPDSIWNNLTDSRLSADVNYNRVTLRNAREFSMDSLHFTLADLFPLKPSLTGPSSVCSNSQNNLFIASSNTDFYEWEIPSGVGIASGEFNDSIYLNFNTTGGLVRAISSSATGRCKEISDSLIVKINPSPIAGFLADTNNVFTKFDIQFTDTSIGTPVEWLWKFGDGDSSFAPVPKHAYNTIGEYQVLLFIKDSKGCIDSTSSWIQIIEGIQIPNVFTPNGDGLNDYFRIANSGINSYFIQIYDRWGNLVFETKAPEIVWDGRNPVGKRVDEGTYFYVLKAQSDATNYNTKGFISVYH